MEDPMSIGEQTRALLGFVADLFNSDPALQEELKGRHGWINLAVGLKTADDMIQTAIVFQDGHVRVLDGIPEETECTIIYHRPEDLMELLNSGPEESFMMIMKGRIILEGNPMALGLWDYLLSLVAGDEQQAAVKKQIEEHQAARQELAGSANTAGRQERLCRRENRLIGIKDEPGVKFLADPYLSRYGLADFPRLVKLRAERLAAQCEFTSEYGKLITDFHMENGYEVDRNGKPWDPLLRKAKSVQYLLENRKPLIRTDDLIGGTWSINPVLGCIARPYAEASYMWGELNTCSRREYAPYQITRESVELFHKYIFPYWRNRSIHAFWKKEYENALGPRIFERFFAIMYWATVSQSENNPGFEKILTLGTKGLIGKIDQELAKDTAADPEKRSTLEGMRLCLQGMEAYARRLSLLAKELADAEADPVRRQELIGIYERIAKVPENPAETLDEAVQSMVIAMLCLGWETMDASISLGRLDQVLQPYFEADLSKLADQPARDAYIKHVLELIGCLYLHVSSREIAAMDMAQLQNSGSAPNTCITFGGVKPDGTDAVNDMTYILLKVTELLALNHPNTHARYKPGVNSMTYLRRVAEVNYITGATPAVHNDDAMINALAAHPGWALEDIRDYASTGCVEPSIPGKHAGTTSALEINLVAPLEMAMHNGRHPVSNWSLGPETGRVEDGVFVTFDAFFDAFRKQCVFLFEQAVVGNNQLGGIFHRHHPHLLLSTLTDSCIETGREFLWGGARYNSSGVAMIGLADVVDSLLVIKKLVFDEAAVTFADLKRAVDANFVENGKLLAMIRTKISRFGSGEPESLAMAKRVMKLVSDFFAGSRDYKGGMYTTGWWSMAHHVTYGRVTSALPSGRLAGEPFTPGLTPHPAASASLLDNLRDVARLDHTSMDNNIAFNVKLVPGSEDTHETVVKNIADYMKTYFELGGMQLQFNVVDSDTLRDAMANPEYYTDLMVRVSGYLVYFTRIHYELQLELVRRAEYGL
ncbi:MAG: pyruvate formate lyase family protein [Bacillota bacterium]